MMEAKQCFPVLPEPFFLLSRKKYSLAYKIQEICRLHMYNNLPYDILGYLGFTHLLKCLLERPKL